MRRMLSLCVLAGLLAAAGCWGSSKDPGANSTANDTAAATPAPEVEQKANTEPSGSQRLDLSHITKGATLAVVIRPGKLLEQEQLKERPWLEGVMIPLMFADIDPATITSIIAAGGPGIDPASPEFAIIVHLSRPHPGETAVGVLLGEFESAEFQDQKYYYKRGSAPAADDEDTEVEETNETSNAAEEPAGPAQSGLPEPFGLPAAVNPNRFYVCLPDEKTLVLSASESHVKQILAIGGEEVNSPLIAALRAADPSSQLTAMLVITPKMQALIPQLRSYVTSLLPATNPQLEADYTALVNDIKSVRINADLTPEPSMSLHLKTIDDAAAVKAADLIAKLIQSSLEDLARRRSELPDDDLRIESYENTEKVLRGIKTTHSGVTVDVDFGIVADLPWLNLLVGLMGM